MESLKNENTNTLKRQIVFAAATLFLEIGYTAATIKKIAEKAQTNTGSLQNIFKTKEDILCELVSFVLESQFDATSKFLEGKTDDKLLFYAAETTLQLYLAESDEKIRELYSEAYSLPKSMEIIRETITVKLEKIFKEHMPQLKRRDFFRLEIASGGIMRSFMTLPCSVWFSMEDKVESFLTSTFRVYCVSEEKITQAIEFVSNFDYPAIVRETVSSMLGFLKDKIM